MKRTPERIEPLRSVNRRCVQIFIYMMDEPIHLNKCLNDIL